MVFRTVQTGHQTNILDDELDNCSSNDKLGDYLFSFVNMLYNLLIVVELFLIDFSEK